jgi:hypothetical protein
MMYEYLFDFYEDTYFAVKNLVEGDILVFEHGK